MRRRLCRRCWCWRSACEKTKKKQKKIRTVFQTLSLSLYRRGPSSRGGPPPPRRCRKSSTPRCRSLMDFDVRTESERRCLCAWKEDSPPLSPALSNIIFSPCRPPHFDADVRGEGRQQDVRQGVEHLLSARIACKSDERRAPLPSTPPAVHLPQAVCPTLASPSW